MASLTDGTNTFPQTAPTAAAPVAPQQPVIPPTTPAPVQPKPQQVTLGNGQVVNVDEQGNFTDTSGKPVSQATVAAAKGQTPTTAPAATPPTTPPGASTSPTATTSTPSATSTPNQQYNSGSGALTNPDGTAAVAPTGAVQSSNGLWYLNGQAYSLAPGTSTPSTTPSTGSTGNANVDALNASYQAQAEAATTFANTINGITSGAIPLNAGQQAQVSYLQQQFQDLISQQQRTNLSSTNTANIRGYQTGAAEYDPMFQAKTINSIAAAGATKIASLQSQEASAVSQLTEALKTDNINNAKTAYQALTDAQTATQNGLKAVIADTQAAINDAHIANVLASGVTDPKDIIAELQKQGYTDISSTDVSNAIKNLSPEAANIFDIQKQAAANGAPADVLAAIGKSTNASDAFAAAGGYSQTLTGDAAQYQFYAQQAKAAGITPKSYTDWQNSQTYNKSFQAAAGQAAGAASALPTFTDTSTGAGLGGGTGGGSILSATGLSIGAFNYLAGNTSALTRLTASQRNAIMQEVTNFANKNGVDVSTLQSQYKALNDVLASNIARENNAKIKGNDVTQTAQQLITALGSSGVSADPLASVHGGGSVIGNLSAGNIAAIAVGKEVNNPFAVKYGTNIALLTNDLAGYLAATRSSSPTGNATPTDQDTRDAAKMVYDGLNAGGLQAFNDIIDSNVKKISNVSGTAVTDTQKQIWGLFGVQNKYQSATSSTDQTIQSQQADETAAQTSVVNYGKTNTQAQTQIKTLVGQGYSYSDIENILGITP